MGLSESDIRLIARFARKAAKAPNMEAVIGMMFETLKAIIGTAEVRVVYSPAPYGWNE